jgi:cellulose biosynthesis protein BcsQ
MYLTEDSIPKEIPLPPIITLISYSAPNENFLLSYGLARAFSLNGYKTILLDWNFRNPFLSFLINQKFKILEPNLSNFYSNPDLSINEKDFFEISIKIPLKDNKELIFVPCSPEPSLSRLIENSDDKIIRKSYNNIKKVIKNLQDQRKFDIMIIHSMDSLNRDSINSLLISTSSFCISQWDRAILSMFSKICENLARINPVLRIHGLLVSNYQALPSTIGNRQKITKLEQELSIPIIGTLMNLPSILESLPFEEMIFSNHWRLDDYMKEFSNLCLEAALNPRMVDKDISLTLNSLFILEKSGLPIYTYMFPNSNLGDSTIASAGLTAVVSGLSQLVGEIVNRKQRTNLIDLSRVKVFVEEDNKIRVMLLASKFDDELPYLLKNFLKSFIEKYHSQISNWLGEPLEFDNAEKLVFSFFGKFYQN